MALPAAQDALLAGDQDHRHAAEQRVGSAGTEIECARPQRRQADPGLAGEPAIGCGHERGRLLVAGKDELDRRAPERFDAARFSSPRDAEDPLDTSFSNAATKRSAPLGMSCLLAASLCIPAPTETAAGRDWR
jgi:hypothetical protein